MGCPFRQSRIFILTFLASSAAPARAQFSIPARLSDRDFWQLATDLSEPGGSFRSDNFVSNELGFEVPIPELRRTTRPGGVYLGVGPEQNFTYIVALQPKMAIIFDIRRQNMMLHLMYKALIEMSVDRREFLTRLFSRTPLGDVDSTMGPGALFGAFIHAPRDSLAYRANLVAIEDWLTKGHGFDLSRSDSSSLEYVYSAFYEGGPAINYGFRPGAGIRFFFARPGVGITNNTLGVQVRPSNAPSSANAQVAPAIPGMLSYAELQSVSDGAGNYAAYLATEANYHWLRDFEERNMLVPVVGDFAGPKSIGSVGRYLKAHNATVTAFYVSNVEDYLFRQGDDWRKWFTNVGTLPLDSVSTFIRASHTGTSNGVLGLTSMLASMQNQVKLFRDGRILSYPDVIGSSH